MAEGTDPVPISQSQNFNLHSGETESLQVLKPFPAPGVSLPQLNSENGEKSRHGIFRVLAGISPGTSASTADPDMQMSNPLCTSAESSVTSAYQIHAGPGAIYSPDNLCNRAQPSSLHGNVFPGCSTATRSPFETGFNMAAPMNNNMLALLFEQYKETRELYKQQQSTLDKLTSAVNNVINTDRSATGEDDCVSEDQYEPVSSDEDENPSDEEPPSKKQKYESSSNISDSKLKKLKFIEAQFSKQEEFGPKVHEVVGSAVNKGLVEPVDHKASQVQDLLKKYNRPENCTSLQVPVVNKLLWSSKQTSKDLKQGDRSFQRVQGYLTKGMIPLVQIMNKTLTMDSEEAEELFDLSLDAFNLLAYSHRDLSSQRRRLLLPAISSRYSSLCNEYENVSSPTHLFGDDKDLERRLKEIDDNQKLGKSLVVTNDKPRQLKTGPRWGAKPQHSRTTHGRDFLGKRALNQHRVAHTHQRMGNRKVEQGQKKQHKF
ncbi:uncharacterized protein LOC132728435 [Ruditapes philippinarum]|uniref:uncharacterized protein LOC132728435 n=1 Tax=Ruditapes philippinarum TaxID=129788 RepID=UPI00295AF73F|nr:uncharacterized protein LOC132728435 [Ruditapes philippinarum]